MFDFDTQIDRKAAFSTKWAGTGPTKPQELESAAQGRGAQTVLPFWIADMDFLAPPFIQQAIADRLAHGIHGYTDTPPQLSPLLGEWFGKHCNYQPAAEAMRWLPGVVPALNLAALACASPGGHIAIPTPVYYPFLNVPSNARQGALPMPLVLDRGRWVMDFDRMAEIADAQGIKGQIGSLLLSNPQNPTGRVYDRAELTQLAEFCLARDITIISDEIHSPLIIDPRCTHQSIAGLADEVDKQCITLHAATKAYNVAGLNAAVAIIANPTLRQRFDDVERGLVSGISPFAYAVTEAAYADTSNYLAELRTYLANNHTDLYKAVNAVTDTHMTPVEATYLGWIDIRALSISQPAKHLQQHGLRLNLGAQFGAPGFIRFNFAAPKAIVGEGIRRLTQALHAAS